MTIPELTAALREAAASSHTPRNLGEVMAAMAETLDRCLPGNFEALVIHELVREISRRKDLEDRVTDMERRFDKVVTAMEDQQRATDLPLED